MPHRINALILAVLASSLVVPMELSAQGPASAAGECLEKFGSQGDQAGHWYYRTDRVNHRQCWFFETTKETTGPTALSNERSPPNAGSEPSWLSWFAAGVQQTFSFGTPDPPVDPTAATSISVSNPPKTSAKPTKPRSPAAPPPDTHHAAGSGLQISPADRDALFQEFLRRYELEKRFSSDPHP